MYTRAYLFAFKIGVITSILLSIPFVAAYDTNYFHIIAYYSNFFLPFFFLVGLVIVQIKCRSNYGLYSTEKLTISGLIFVWTTYILYLLIFTLSAFILEGVSLNLEAIIMTTFHFIWISAIVCGISGYLISSKKKNSEVSEILDDEEINPLQ